MSLVTIRNGVAGGSTGAWGVTALVTYPERPGMYAPAVLDSLVDFVAREPVLAGLMVLILLVVFFAYLFMRKTVSSMREGFDDAYRGK